MTAPDELRALAARAEAATGPDRDIDGWIHVLVHPETMVIGNKPGRFPQDPIYGPSRAVMEQLNGKDGADYIGAPLYTASLDAAMTLFAPDDARVINLSIGPWNAGQCRTWRATEPNEVTIGDAATLPLAICAAALRALAKETNDG